MNAEPAGKLCIRAEDLQSFAGVFSGSAFAGEVTNHTEGFTKPQDVGHFFMAIRPNLFMTQEQFAARMDVLVRRVKDGRRAQGFDEILVSGEPGSRKEAGRRRTGIALPRTELDAPMAEAAAHGVGLPPMSSTPYA